MHINTHCALYIVSKFHALVYRIRKVINNFYPTMTFIEGSAVRALSQCLFIYSATFYHLYMTFHFTYTGGRTTCQYFYFPFTSVLWLYFTSLFTLTFFLYLVSFYFSKPVMRSLCVFLPLLISFLVFCHQRLCLHSLSYAKSLSLSSAEYPLGIFFTWNSLPLSFPSNFLSRPFF